MFNLDAKFAEEVRRGGVSRLNEATAKPWQSTPVWVEGNDIPRWQSDFVDSLGCIEDEKIRALFERLAAGTTGYYQVQKTNSITLIAPRDGIAMVGGYE
ncbi:hypothetical protein GCM10007874_68940 [Labrys miyagiensis]|uniref:Uncharacterized protein n=1 Tax=Labrys miyagiensis TaxID=346912 RepID=A0ABQ6CVL8_9HYPH|nr:hypothetical protein GCM10007874_68940 [Labrys miyagiensis]